MSRQIRFPLRNLMAAAGAVAALAMASSGQAQTTYKVIGQPAATGMVQKNYERPFFENFAERTGLNINADYKPVDQLGIKDTEQLRVMKAGLFDIVSLRVSQNSRDEPTLLGLDLVGAAPDYATARKIYDAYLPVVDERLQKQFNVKMLGAWPFGPQILFCKKPVASLADLKGLKVRTYDQNLAKFMESVGASPVPLSFTEVHQALSLGVVDCAITGPSSANSSGWPEVTTHQYALGVQMAMNGYGISLKRWKELSTEEQQKLQAAFTKLTDDIWKYSEELTADAMACNAGKDSCELGKKYHLIDSPLQEADRAVLTEAVSKISVPTWAEICDRANKDCSANWKATAGKVLGIE
ncbi:ABC transporter substrate-binding protein [Lampropedia puyangensis]|uniref:ABC transporter substrate-binding protein n=1 Tax=Lampropedia puyangensis TaxID=1330072 RepID=A0A4V4GSI0_9BURK|nr:TRAP transporter substrate-binding protein [Lampropedia puyangensis]THU04486.1 ABC transporter substrate-binding protein [Lampropedia puyangensis]